MKIFSIETADTEENNNCFHAFDGEKFVAVPPYDDEACYRFPFPRTVRAISFEGNIADPYLLWHDAGEQALNDNVLENLAKNWKAAHGGFSDASAFEDFLTWLEVERGYRQIIVSDKILDF